MLGSSLKALGVDGPTIPLGFGSPAAIGRVLLERFLIAFEAASLLLLLAAVGAVVLPARGGDPAPPDGERGAGSDRSEPRRRSSLSAR